MEDNMLVSNCKPCAADQKWCCCRFEKCSKIVWIIAIASSMSHLIHTVTPSVCDQWSRYRVSFHLLFSNVSSTEGNVSSPHLQEFSWLWLQEQWNSSQKSLPVWVQVDLVTIELIIKCEQCGTRNQSLEKIQDKTPWSTKTEVWWSSVSCFYSTILS